MAIPLSYNLRNLVVRKTTTIMTALGIALTVAVLLAVLSLVNGLHATLSSSGDPLHILVMRKGATSELASVFLRAQYQDLKFKPGIATGPDGQPLAALEMVTVINLVSVDSPDGVNVTIRGVQPLGIAMRHGLKIQSGHWFDAGRRELVVGSAIAKRFPDAHLGKKLKFARGEWEIVGIMDAGRGMADSEIWADLNQVSSDYQRVDALSSALVQAPDAVTAKALVEDLNNDQRLAMLAVSEKDYYDDQMKQGLPIESIGIFIAIVMAVGSSFAAMNTMYAAVSRRAREIGTLRVLGFSRGSIMVSFFFESVLLAGLGGLLGCLLVLPLNGITTAVGNANFSEMAFDFQITPRIMLTGIVFAAILGSVGGLFPARNASRKEILTALREV